MAQPMDANIFLLKWCLLLIPKYIKTFKQQQDQAGWLAKVFDWYIAVVSVMLLVMLGIIF